VIFEIVQQVIFELLVEYKVYWTIWSELF